MILYKQFQIDGNYFVYDFNSNNFLKISKEEFTLLDKFNGRGDREQLKKEMPQFLEEADKKRVFQNSRFKRVSQGLSNLEELTKKIENNAESLTLIVTEACNLRCNYCIYGEGNYFGNRVHQEKNMPEYIAIKATEDFLKRTNPSDKPPFICFYGGEPLLRWELIKKTVNYAETVSSLEKQWFVNTNGVYLTEEKFDFMIQNGFMARVSLDGPKEIHDKNRIKINGEGTFNEVYENLRRLREKNPYYFKRKVSLSFVISDADKVIEIRDFFLKDLLLKDIPKICSQINSKANLNKELETTMPKDGFSAQRDNFIKFLSEKTEASYEHPFNFWWAKYLSNLEKREIRTLDEVEQMSNICIPAAHRLVIHPNGDYSFCIQGAESFKIGDIKEGINYDKIKKIMEKTEEKLSKRCPNCWCARFCPICPAFFTINGELSDQLLEESCERIKQNLEISFETYIRLAMKKSDICNKIIPSDERLPNSDISQR